MTVSRVVIILSTLKSASRMLLHTTVARSNWTICLCSTRTLWHRSSSKTSLKPMIGLSRSQASRKSRLRGGKTSSRSWRNERKLSSSSQSLNAWAAISWYIMLLNARSSTSLRKSWESAMNSWALSPTRKRTTSSLRTKYLSSTRWLTQMKTCCLKVKLLKRQGLATLF